MSTEPDETGRDDANLPTVDDDVTSTGAAADSAEIDELCPGLPAQRRLGREPRRRLGRGARH